MNEKDIDLDELANVFRADQLQDFGKYLESKGSKHILFETWYQYIMQIAQSPNANVVNRAIQQLCNFALTYRVENLILIANAHNALEQRDFVDTNISWDTRTEDIRTLKLEDKKAIIESLARKLRVNVQVF